MPEGYDVPIDDDGSMGEQLLGRGDGKRATKTFIEDGPLAMILGLMGSFHEMLMNTARRMHAEQNGQEFKEVSNQVILEEYPEAQEFMRLHLSILEHKGSQAGYLVDRYTRSASPEDMERKKENKESSGESEGSGRWI